MQYRKRPLVVEAVRFMGIENGSMSLEGIDNRTGDYPRWMDRAENMAGEEGGICRIPETGKLYLQHNGSQLLIEKGDWIIRGIKGELYPCKDDVFNAAYAKLQPGEELEWEVLQQQSIAWRAVVATLSKVAPEWARPSGKLRERAVEAIEWLARMAAGKRTEHIFQVMAVLDRLMPGWVNIEGAGTVGEAAAMAIERLSQVSGAFAGGVRAIGAERARQVVQEGWSEAHDDRHDKAEMARAAACYAAPRGYRTTAPTTGGAMPVLWPWALEWWKPGGAGIPNRLREIEKAGALLAAEWDRLDRQRQRQAAAMASAMREQAARPNTAVEAGAPYLQERKLRQQREDAGSDAAACAGFGLEPPCGGLTGTEYVQAMEQREPSIALTEAGRQHLAAQAVRTANAEGAIIQAIEELKGVQAEALKLHDKAGNVLHTLNSRNHKG